MEINILDDPYSVKFKDLPRGHAFNLKGEIYLKIDEVVIDNRLPGFSYIPYMNSIRLKDGTLSCFDPETAVLPVECKLFAKYTIFENGENK